MKPGRFYRVCLPIRSGFLFFLFSLLIFAPPGARADEEEKVPDEGKGAFIRTVNGAYYNIERLGFQGLVCEVTNDSLEELIEAVKADIRGKPEKGDPESLKFTIILDEKKKLWFGWPEHELSDEKLGKAMKFRVESTKASLLGFFRMWQGFVVEPIFRKTDISCEIKKIPNRYEISFPDETGHPTRMLLDGEYRILEIDSRTGDTAVKTVPEFENTAEGVFLLKGYDIEVGEGLAKTSAVIGYAEVSGLQLPVSVKMQSMVSDIRMLYSFEFLNCRVVKK